MVLLTRPSFYFSTSVRLVTLNYTFPSLLTDLRSRAVALVFENRTPAGRAPTARGYHAAILTDGRLFIFGGSNGNDIYDDVHILDLAGAAYLPQVTSFRIDVDNS